MIVKKDETTSHRPTDLSQAALKILLVEKEWPEQRLVSKMLEARGCTVTPAANLQEAGNLLKSTDVDMVLMDTDIFKQNGFDIMAVIEDSERKNWKRIPMIALAENFAMDHRDYFIGIGMDEYLPKPVFEEALCRTVEKLAESVAFSAPVSSVQHDNKKDAVAIN